MKIINDGIPDLIYRAITNDVYDRGEHSDISVTQLIAPPQQVRIKRDHYHDIVKKASDMTHAFMGQLRHSILERVSIDGAIKERRFYADIDDRKISGQIDFWFDGKLTDLKTTSVWKIKDVIANGSDEWESQLNIYAWLMRLSGYDVSSCSILMIATDWKRSDSLRYKDYPKVFTEIEFPLWDDKECGRYISERLKLHFQNEIIQCTDAERWKKDDVYAIMKKGRKSALPGGLCKTEQEANEKMKSLGGTHIDHRKGGYTRCDKYCDASPWCGQLNSDNSA
jgi:hypothetical protein